MNSNIAPKYYFDTKIVELEKSTIFKKNWLFVGFKSELPEHNDFITLNLVDIPIVIQNFNGILKAYLNVCSHRFSILQSEKKGNRALVCPYHGWAYNDKGIPFGIPKQPYFKEFTNQELCSLKLKEFELDFCGDFMFVKLEESSKSLMDYLGQFFLDLERISYAKSKLIDTNAFMINANWKILVENTLESYHVNLVHANTFRKLGAKGLNFLFDGLHSCWDAELIQKVDDEKLKKIHRNYEPMSYNLDYYKHIFIYPNLLISSTYGISFNFSLIDCIDQENSFFTSYVYTAKNNNNNAVTEYYESSLKEFNRSVFDEDKAICELVQRGVANSELQGLLSDEEERVHVFQKEYLKQIHEGIH